MRFGTYSLEEKDLEQHFSEELESKTVPNIIKTFYKPPENRRSKDSRDDPANFYSTVP